MAGVTIGAAEVVGGVDGAGAVVVVIATEVVVA